MVLNFHRNNASYSPEKAEQEEFNVKQTSMIAQVTHPYNLQKALRQVVVNKGSAGVDGLKTSQLEDCFRERNLHYWKTLKITVIYHNPFLALRFQKEAESSDF